MVLEIETRHSHFKLEDNTQVKDWTTVNFDQGLEYYHPRYHGQGYPTPSTTNYRMAAGVEGARKAIWKAFLWNVYRRDCPTGTAKLDLRKSVLADKPAKTRKRTDSAAPSEHASVAADECSEANTFADGEEEAGDEQAGVPKFRELHPELVGKPMDIWNAYNLDTAAFDMTNPNVCKTISSAWESAVTVTDRPGPPNGVLQEAMRQKREEDCYSCRATPAFNAWNLSQRSGHANPQHYWWGDTTAWKIAIEKHLSTKARLGFNIATTSEVKEQAAKYHGEIVSCQKLLARRFGARFWSRTQEKWLTGSEVTA